MGDHGQTINGDHGGGSAEEVKEQNCSLFSLYIFGWNITYNIGF